MVLTEREIQHVIEQAKTAFPNFTNWKYNNEINEDYFGFSLWGQFVLYPDDLMSSRYLFITFDTYEDTWRGHLTIGQPCYLWSSADVGDAHLLETASCQTFEETIIALKGEIRHLLHALSGV